MQRNLKVFWFHFKGHLQRTFEYRLSLVLWILNGFIGPFMALVVWLTVSKGGELALSSSDLVTYFLSSIVVIRLTQSWSLESIGRRIKKGAFSQYLLHPSPYFLSDLANNLATKLFRLLTLFPFLVVFFLIFRQQLEINLLKERWVLFLLAAILGFLINYFFQNAIAILAFWTTEINGIGRTFDIIQSFFSGSFVPIILMPDLLRKIMLFLPFRFFLSFPIEILLSSLQTNILVGFISGIFWLFFWLLLWLVLFKKGVKKYSAVSG